MLQMFKTIIIGVSILVLVSVVYVLAKAYRNGTMRLETFQNSATKNPTLAAPPGHVQQTVSMEPPRVVSPAGPNPPNQRPQLEAPPKMSPPEKPMDPYEETNSEAPVRDNLRHPENSFGPGVEPVGTAVNSAAGISAKTVQAGLNTFSPEFVQNGGEVMGGVTAHDWSDSGGTFATV